MVISGRELMLRRILKCSDGIAYSFCIRQHAFTFYLGKHGQEGTVAVMSFGEMAADLFKSVAGLQYCIVG